MKKQQLFLWGVQAILASGVMQAAELWMIKKLSVEALTASKRIPRSLSAEAAVDAFYLHIIGAKGGSTETFSNW
ncbi:hypothetical protein ACOZB2_30310 [Pantoea endophytica]|uniref:Uncharacterized protein n=1 Tax=Pantoea sp. BJ2 TaxID=3141322 RepID=A0AAU7TR96_9GAMM